MVELSGPGSNLRTSQYRGVLDDLRRRAELRAESRQYTLRAIATRWHLAKNTVWKISAFTEDG